MPNVFNQEYEKICILTSNKIYNMGLTISSETLNIIGIIYSGIGVALALFETFVKKVHSRALDYIQWSYILILANTALAGTFSSYLYVGSSLIVLDPQALNDFYCPMGTYVCVRPFALSFLAILVGFLIIVRLITIPEKVTQKGLTFPRIYRFFKGLFKWFYLPLIYLSISYLIAPATSDISIPAIVVLAVLLIYPIIQLLLYKKFDPETEDPFIKWLQFCNYVKAALFALLVVLATTYATTSFYYYISVVLIAYAIFFGFQHNFGYPVVGRVFYISGEVIFYFLYSLFVSGSSWLATYYLDLFILGIILLIDTIYLIMQTVVECKKWRGQGDIIPEDSKDGPLKKNRYEVQQLGIINKNDSRDNLNESRASSNMLANSSNIKKKDTRPRPGGK